MTKVYAILAHPRKDSLVGTLFYTTVKQMRAAGATVDVLDLYERAPEVLFYEQTLKNTHNAFFEENKARFMTADRILIMYPVFWYAVPGIMKCWLDLITSYAFTYGPEQCTIFSNYAIPKHTIKKALVVNSAAMHSWFRWLRTKNSGTEMVKESLKFLSIWNNIFYEIGSTSTLTPDKVQQHQTKILKYSDWLIS